MLKRIILLTLVVLIALCGLVSCNNDTDTDSGIQTDTESTNNNVLTGEQVFNLYNSFAFSKENHSGFRYNIKKSVGNILTNEQDITLTLKNGGNSGTRTEILKSLNPDIDGDTYITKSAIFEFNGNIVKKDYVETTEYTVSDITSVELLKISSSYSELSNVEYENGVLSFKAPAGSLEDTVANLDGIESIDFDITVDNSGSLKTVVVSYQRGKTSIVIEFSVM